MADDGFQKVGMTGETGGLDVALKWIKSNWTILSFLAVGAVYMIRTDSDIKNEFENIDVRFEQLSDKAEKRADVADKFYAAQRDLNLPIRVQNLETQVRDILVLIQRGQERQEASAAGINDKLQAISVQVNVVASKVDDLRADTPRKTNLLFTPRPATK